MDRSHSLSGTLAELRRVAKFSRIPLRGLTADEVHRMMTGIAGDDVPWSLSETVHRQTEGNPLFVQEVLRYLVEQGYLGREGDGTRRETPPEMGLPEGLKDVIGKRLSGLSDGCQSVLSVAAVIGREFPLQVLQRVAGLSEEELYTALEEASGVGVVEERSTTGSGIGFRFAHAFFRQTLYEETFAPRRIRLHQQVGRALEEVHSARPAEHAAELTDHFAQSTEREDLEKALRYGEMAAERAMSVYAYGEAVRLLEQVQEVLDPDDKAQRCDLLLALGEAMMPAGDPLRASEVVAPEAFDLAEELNDNRLRSAASKVGIWGLLRYGVQTIMGEPAFHMWAERADRFAAPESSERVLADAALSWLKLANQEHAESKLLAAKALELARRLDDPQALWDAAVPIIAGLSSPPRDLEARIRLAHEVADWPRDGVPAVTVSYGLRWSVLLFLVGGKRDRAEALRYEVEELGERTGDGHPILLSIGLAGLLLFIDGQLEESLRAAERLADSAEELGCRRWGDL